MLSKEVKSFCKTIVLLLLCIVLSVAGFSIYKKTQTSTEVPTLTVEDATLSDSDVQAIINSYLPDNTRNPNVPASHQIPMEIIYQNPELPAGCEVTALAMLLTHSGLPTDKCILADNYLPKGEIGMVNMKEFFVGDPRIAGSYGCYAPVIINCATNYIAHKGANLKVYDLSGAKLSSLFTLIADDKPVIVWTTISMLESEPTTTWTINGEIVTWYSQEHCVVLTGYDYDANTVTVADPLYGIKEYDLDIFTERYNQMFQQAICIY